MSRGLGAASLAQYSKSQIREAVDWYKNKYRDLDTKYQQSFSFLRDYGSRMSPADGAAAAAALKRQTDAMNMLTSIFFQIDSLAAPYLAGYGDSAGPQTLGQIAMAGVMNNLGALGLPQAAVVAIIAAIVGVAALAAIAVVETQFGIIQYYRAKYTNAQTTASAKDTIQDMCAKGLLPPQQCADSLVKISQNATDQAGSRYGSSFSATSVAVGALFVGGLLWAMFED